MEGGHAEKAGAARAEHKHLDHHGGRLDNKQRGDDDHEQFGPGSHGNASHQAAECKRAGVSHEDFRGCRVPPQEPKASTQAGRSQDGQVEGVAHRVAARFNVDFTGIAELPERDGGVRTHNHGGTASGESVEAVGEVHGVGPGAD